MPLFTMFYAKKLYCRPQKWLSKPPLAESKQDASNSESEPSEAAEFLQVKEFSS